ncbi:CDP-alcohol phosphatidyltransferase family protein [Chloroflexota bacterium]
MTKLLSFRKSLGRYTTEPMVWLLVRTSVTPNMLTWFGFCLAIVTAVVIVSGNLLVAGLLVLFSGYFDILDGALARRTDKVTRYGCVLDATLDRLSEAAVLFGILVLFVTAKDTSSYSLISREWAIYLVVITLIISPLVSYIRARSEASGIQCEVGIFTRMERVLLLALGLLINQVVIIIAIIALFSFITCGQRLYYVYKKTTLL